MTPRMRVIPALTMVTRPSTKIARPAKILLPKPRRTPEEMQILRSEEAAKKKAEEERLIEGLTKVAAIEDQNRLHEIELQEERRRQCAQLKNNNPTATVPPSNASGFHHEITTEDQATYARATLPKSSKQAVPNDDLQRASGDMPLEGSDMRLRGAAGSKGKEKASQQVVEEDESDDSTKDPDFRKGSDEDMSLAETDSDLDQDSDASEVSTKKKGKKPKKGRKDVRALRKTQEVVPLINKRKAVNEPGPALNTAPNHQQKKTKVGAIHGIDTEWQEAIKKRAEKKLANLFDEQCGGFVADDEDDRVEASVIKTLPRSATAPCTGGYPLIKIESTEFKTLREARGGANKWTLKHLPVNTRASFQDEVVPRLRKLLGSLEPWTLLMEKHVQSVLDEVYGLGEQSATTNGPFFGLSKMRIENWRNGFAQEAMNTVNSFISDYPEVFDSPASIKAGIDLYLSSTLVSPGSQSLTYAYQWDDWKDEGRDKSGFCQNDLILRTFALAHLATIESLQVSLTDKHMGALLMSMQAIGRALDIWKGGQKSIKKLPAFSHDNYGDTSVKKECDNGRLKRIKIRRATVFVPTIKTFNDETWRHINKRASEFIPDSKKKRASSSSSSVTVGTDDELVEMEDPDMDLIMAY